MFFGKSYWKSMDQGIQREWLLSNGIGGFSCGTIIGMNARRYHGLLIASLTPPVERMLVLSQISEGVVLDRREFYLHAFQTHDYAAHGHHHLEAFYHHGFPEFHYRIGTTTIEKKICLRYGMNQAAVVYHIRNPHKKGSLRLTPLINFRNYHYLSFHQYMSFSTDADGRRIRITPYNMDKKILLDCSEGKAVLSEQDYFYNMEYPYERERGLNSMEDHFIPGYYEIELKPGDEKTVTLICSMDEPIDTLDGETIIQHEKERQKSITERFEQDFFMKQLVLAADKFIVYRKSINSKTIIAGYPWFTDWGRDTMIAFHGLTLTTGRYADAKEILYTFARYEKNGLIPNVFPDESGEPAYNTVDAALWYFEAVYQYLKKTADLSFIKEQILPVLIRIIDHYRTGTDYDIRMDLDGLITAGNEETQLTWMDAKAGDWVVTPRHGKAVEINALWYNALRVAAEMLEQTEGNGGEYRKLADKVKRSFIKEFWNEKTSCLFDVINKQGADKRLRPNQIIAVSLSFPVLEGDMAKCVVDTVHQTLYTALGLRTLSTDEPHYRGVYLGDQYARDGAYHQGTVWAWPLGRFITAYARVYHNQENLQEHLKSFFLPFRDHLRDAGLGSISEIFDGNEPLIPRGCFAQAWSVSEILRAYVEDYLPLQREGEEMQ